MGFNSGFKGLIMLFLGSISCDFCIRHDDTVQGPLFHQGVVYLPKSDFRHGPPQDELTEDGIIIMLGFLLGTCKVLSAKRTLKKHI